MSSGPWHAAFQRWVDALNCPRDGAALSAAVADDVWIDRHAPGALDTAPISETFAGVAEVARWLARTPAVATFSLAGAAAPDPGGAGETWTIEYAIEAGEFRNRGSWRARLAADGRIAFLSHHPRALRAPTGG